MILKRHLTSGINSSQKGEYLFGQDSVSAINDNVGTETMNPVTHWCAVIG